MVITDNKAYVKQVTDGLLGLLMAQRAVSAGSKSISLLTKPLLVVFLLFFLTSLSVFAAEVSPRAILVLDASGSMWGQVQGKTKIEIARQVIAGLVENSAFNIDLGLTVYGHRRKGDCSDIEHLIPVAKGNAKRIVRMVNALKPMGKTPLSDAVRQAAEQLRYSEEKATVILVTDGKETCDQDPCALGRALEESGLDFTAHVIGFNVAKEEHANLKCLADATGGLFLTADDAGALNSALDAAVDQVRAGPEPGARLIAVLGDTTEPAPMAVEWTIYQAGGNDMKGAQVATEAGASVIIRPESGRYVVEAKASNVAGRAVIEVEAGKDSQHLVRLEAGKAVLSALAAAEGPLFKAREPVFWRVYLVKNGKPAAKYVASLGGNPATFLLSPGDYLGRAESGSNKGEIAFTIVPGETADAKFILATGEVELKALNSANGTLFKGKRQPFWRVYPLNNDGQRAKRYLSSNKGNPRRFTLSPGRYLATVESGKLNAEIAFEVIPDKTVQAAAVLARAEARLTLVSTPGGAVFTGNKPVRWRVYRIGQDGKAVRKSAATKRGNPATVDLGVGEYEARYQSGKNRGSSHFSLRAGESRSVEVVIEAQ